MEPFQTSAETDKLDEALALAQAEIEDASKDGNNKHFGSRYATLSSVRSAVRGPLAKHGISYTQWPTTDDAGRLVIITRLACKGQWILGRFAIPVVKQDPQSYVSSTTYGRRCGLAAATGLAPDDDDDGETGAGRPPEKKPEPQPKAEDKKPAKPAPVSEGLRRVLVELCCKTPEQSDAVIRHCTRGQLCLSDCRGSDGNSETARVDIEATLGGIMAATDPPTSRVDSLSILFADALEAVEKGGK